MKRIGITVRLSKGLWTNGINQNAIYFANLLKEIGYSVYLIHDLKDEHDDIHGIKAVTIDKSFSIPFNLMVQFGFAIQLPLYERYKDKNKNVKLIAYECGNRFIMDMEAVLFKPNENTVIKNTVKPDQIWSIPQMEKSNLEYYKFLNGQNNATVVPFIWEPLSIEKYCIDNNIKPYSLRATNRVGVFEANSSVMKNIILPIAALDVYQTQYGNLSDVILYTTEHLKTGETFKALVTKTKMFEEGILFSQARLPIMYALNNLSDIVFS